MKLYQLYLITNTINNKKYVGQTIQYSENSYLQRFLQHVHSAYSEIKSHNNCILHRAIKKYGEKSFSIKLLMHNIPEHDINRLEMLWIKKLHTYYYERLGYNMTLGGSGVIGHIRTEESKRIAGEKMHLWWEQLKQENPQKYELFCKNRSERVRGIKRSEHTRKLLSSCASKRISEKNPFYGKHHTERTKQLISEANSVGVVAEDIKTGEVYTFPSVLEATKWLLNTERTKNKSASSRICKICRGIDKSAYGFYWKYQ